MYSFIDGYKEYTPSPANTFGWLVIIVSRYKYTLKRIHLDAGTA